MRIVRLIAIRVFSVVPVTLGVLALTFFLSRVIAGDPVDTFVGDNADVRLRAELIEEFGLDKPVSEQFILYMKDAVRGDLGTSVFTRQPVTEELLHRLPATLELSALAFTISIVGGIALGVIAAIKREGKLDYVARGVSLLGISVPSFWLGLIVLYVFFYLFGLFPGPVGRYPIGGSPPDGPTDLFVLDSILALDWGAFKTSLHHLILPSLVLGFVSMALIARITRSAMLETLESDYIRAARAMGIPARTIYFRYALKNALLPVITIIGGGFAFMFSGTVLIESVFNWPGVGLYALQALQRADYPALQGFVVWAAVIYVLAFMFVDILYYVVDPRIR